MFEPWPSSTKEELNEVPPHTPRWLVYALVGAFILGGIFAVTN